MVNLILVMAGGAVGSGARYLFGKAALTALGPNYPWGTLGVNLIGGLLMGLLVGTLARINTPGEQWRLLLAVGVLGGFTTFSSFALDTVTLVQRGMTIAALGYIVVSVLGAIAAVALGMALVRAFA